MLKYFVFFVSAFSFSFEVFCEETRQREYHLEIRQETVNFTGKPVDFALSVYRKTEEGFEGGIPGPVLHFVEGEVAIIHVKNRTQEKTSVHWHGLLVPWDMDGVPGLNTPSIKPGQTFTFRIPLRQNGTYWYHSHTKLQEQRGVYGAIVIHPKDETKRLKVDYDLVLVLSDWIDEHPQKVIAKIKKDGHYYAWKKNAIPNYIDAMKEGSLKDYLANQWARMEGMDFGDIAYDKFLINGKDKSRILAELKKGDKLRLRLINAAASTYFHINFAQQAFEVLSADGQDVLAVKTKELLMGMAETYDIVFTVPEEAVAYELKATAQDVTGVATVVLGKGTIEKAPTKLKPSIYKMTHDHSNHVNKKDQKDAHSYHAHHKHHMDSSIEPKDKASQNIIQVLSYSDLKSKNSTAFKKETPEMEFKIKLTGDMDRYVWMLNGKLLSEDTYINIKEGYLIRFTLVNETMMHHPMHLHGHFFRVLNGQRDFAPLKHTVDVPPFQTVKIEFLANEPGEWFFHCHNLYHMKSGMTRVIRYENFKRPATHPETKEVPLNEFKKMDSTFYASNEFKAYSHGANWDIRFNGGRYEIESETELNDYDFKKIENETYIKRYFSRYFTVLAGLEYHDRHLAPIIGGSYVLPMNFEFMAYINIDKDFVFELEKKMHITKQLFIDLELEKHSYKDLEYGIALSYHITQNRSFGVRYRQEENLKDSWGLGLELKW